MISEAVVEGSLGSVLLDALDSSSVLRLGLLLLPENLLLLGSRIELSIENRKISLSRYNPTEEKTIFHITAWNVSPAKSTPKTLSTSLVVRVADQC